MEITYQSDQINELAKALSSAQADIQPAKKDSENPFFKSTYADLSSVWEACRAALVKNHLAVTQTTLPTDGKSVSVMTTLVHASGQWIRGVLTMTPVKSDPQAIGSCLTYARRYALSAMVGVCPVDDDAELATTTVGDVKTFEDLENFMISFGKFAKRRLKEVDKHEIGSYLDYIYKEAKKKDKPISGNVREFVETAEEYLKQITSKSNSRAGVYETPYMGDEK